MLSYIDSVDDAAFSWWIVRYHFFGIRLHTIVNKHMNMYGKKVIEDNEWKIRWKSFCLEMINIPIDNSTPTSIESFIMINGSTTREVVTKMIKDASNMSEFDANKYTNYSDYKTSFKILGINDEPSEDPIDNKIILLHTFIGKYTDADSPKLYPEPGYKNMPIIDLYYDSQFHYSDREDVIKCTPLPDEEEGLYQEFFSNPNNNIPYTIVCALPNSLLISQKIVDFVDEYIETHKTCEVRMVAIRGNPITTNMNVKKEMGAFVYTYRDSSVYNAMVKDITKSYGRFPYIKNSMRSFRLQYNNLLDIANNIPLEWNSHINDLPLGNVISNNYRIADYYAEPVRIKCNELGRISTIGVWQRMCLTGEINKYVSPREANDAIWNISHGCTLFNPVLAIYVYKKYSDRSNIKGITKEEYSNIRILDRSNTKGITRILDSTAEYGSKLIASHICGAEEYVGWSSNTEMESIYKKQLNKCNLVSGRNMKCEFNMRAFENDYEMFLEGGKYNSYFDISLMTPTMYEKGSEEQWYNGYFRKHLIYSYMGLKPGGVLAVYMPSKTRTLKTQMPNFAHNVLVDGLGAIPLGWKPDGKWKTPKNVIGYNNGIRHVYVWVKPLVSVDKAPFNIIDTDKYNLITFHGMKYGIFEDIRPYFESLKDKGITKINVNVSQPCIDAEVIPYICNDLGIKCTVILPTRFRAYKRPECTIIYSDTKVIGNTFTLENGLDHEGIKDILRESLKDIPEGVWMWEHDVCVKILTDRNPNVVQAFGSVLKYPGIKTYNAMQGYIIPSKTYPPYECNAYYDAKVWNVIKGEKPTILVLA